MVKGDLVIASLLASTVAGMTLRQGEYSCAPGSDYWLYSPYGSVVMLHIFLGEYTKSIPLLLTSKEEERKLIIRSPRAEGFLSFFP